jgi:hypothetical protein
MTPTEEVRFIELWQQGLESAEIARQLGIPRGTVSSRAATLVRQGKIQPRPRGGAYPKQQAKARQGQGHDAAPVQSGAVQSSAEPLTLTPDEARAERWEFMAPSWLAAAHRSSGEGPWAHSQYSGAGSLVAVGHRGGSMMRAPHVVALYYRLETDSSLIFDHSSPG